MSLVDSAGSVRNHELPGLKAPTSRGRSTRFIGDIIVDLGYASRESVEAGIAESRANGRRTGEVLVERGVLTPDQLARVVAERFGVDHLDLGVFKVDMSAANLLPSSAAKRYGAVPVRFLDERTLLVAMIDPGNVEVVDLRESATDAPVVKLVNSLIGQGVEQGASDIHFEPVDGDLLVRYRIDGVLSEATRVPRRLVAGVISRVKIMSELDIAERRVPQDGRVKL